MIVGFGEAGGSRSHSHQTSAFVRPLMLRLSHAVTFLPMRSVAEIR